VSFTRLDPRRVTTSHKQCAATWRITTTTFSSCSFAGRVRWHEFWLLECSKLMNNVEYVLIEEQKRQNYRKTSTVMIIVIHHVLRLLNSNKLPKNYTTLTLLSWWICLEVYLRKSYLPGTEESAIIEADPPGWGPTIALRLGWPLRLPQMWVSRVHNLC